MESITPRARKKKSSPIKEASQARIVFLSWRAYAKQVKRDRELFFKIRDFIVARLSRKAFRGFKINFINVRLVKHCNYRKRRKQLSRVFSQWKNRERDESLSQIKIQRMVDILGTRMSFAKLRLHVTHKKQKLRMKMRVLRFWAQQTKLKVLNALRNNIEYRFSKREQAFKVYLFDQKRLMSLGIQAFKQHKLALKRDKVNRFKALKFISRLYKGKGLKAFKVHRTLKRFKVYQQQQIEMLLQRRCQRAQQQVLFKWSQALQSQKQKAQLLGQTLINALELRQTLYRIGAIGLEAFQHHALLLKRKSFEGIRVHQKHRQTKRLSCHKALNRYSLTLKKQLFSLLEDYKRQKQKQVNQIRSITNRLLVKQALKKLAEHARSRALLPQLIDKLYLSRMKNPWRTLYLNQKLSVLNDSLLTKLTRGQYFQHWKEHAQCDKRYLKLMARAIKHHKRVTKQKLFFALKRVSQPLHQAVPSLRSHLLLKSLQALMQHKIKARVKSFKKVKAQRLNAENLLQKYFQLFLSGVQSMSQSNQNKTVGMVKVDKMRKYTLLTKGMKGLQIGAYRTRVQKYLQQQNYLKKGALLIENLKEGYYRKQAQHFKKLRAQRYRQNNLLNKSFYALKQSSEIKRYANFMQARADRFYCYGLVRRSFISLYQKAARKRQQRHYEKQAYQERLAVTLREVLTKMLAVGIYWGQIKGRFGNTSRMQLAMKYGMRWRAKAILIKQDQAKQSKPISLQAQQVPRTATDKVKQLLMKGRQPALLQTPANKSSSVQQPSVADIEKELLAFKKKKLLLRELGQQLTESSNQQIRGLLENKVSNLKNELGALQPLIKQLLNDISVLKAEQGKSGAQSLTYQGSESSLLLSNTMMSGFK